MLPRAIQDGASGMPVNRLTLAELVNRSPSSSYFRELTASSRAYGLTKGGTHADTFELTDLGSHATGADEVAQQAAIRSAVLNIAPYRTFLELLNGRRVPASSAMRDFLIANASVPESRVDECIDHLLADARAAGFIRVVKGAEYIDLNGSTHSAPRTVEIDNGSATADTAQIEVPGDPLLGSTVAATSPLPSIAQDRGAHAIEAETPRKVFIAHGKNRKPLEQLKAMLKELGVDHAVAIDEPNSGRPISAKVASLMRDECSSAIFIFTADERFLTVDQDGELTKEVWRPSENVVYELGAASVLYGRRIVLFKEDRVTLPSDFSDLGHISFHGDQLDTQMLPLLRELVALKIVEIRAAR
jgi:predicted nucleotide-binding protein